MPEPLTIIAGGVTVSGLTGYLVKRYVERGDKRDDDLDKRITREVTDLNTKLDEVERESLRRDSEIEKEQTRLRSHMDEEFVRQRDFDRLLERITGMEQRLETKIDSSMGQIIDLVRKIRE